MKELLNASTGVVAAYGVAAIASIKENQVRAIIAVIVIVTAAISALLPYQTQSTQWLQGAALLIIGFYFGASHTKAAAKGESANGTSK